MSELVWQRILDDELRDIVYPAQSDIHGTGLFSSRRIGEGEYIGTFHGSNVTEDGEHVLWIENNDNPDEFLGIQGENLLRFLNHDDNANAEFHGLDLYASADIEQDSEITLDYCSEELE